MVTINRAIVARVAGAAAVAAALFTASFEGQSNKVYLDTGGIKTVCEGHAYTGPDGKPLRTGAVYSNDVCSYLLGKDIRSAQDTLKQHVRVPLSDGETLAYTDFVFNVGAGSFARSTLLRQLNAGDHKGACEQLLAWDKGTVRGKQVVIVGLQKRRAAERAACLG